MTFKLDPLPFARMVDANGRPTQAYQRLFNKALDKIESQINDILAAQAAATAAQASATAAAREAARLTSYPNPGDGILHAADVGTDVTITIDNHTRVYPVQGTIDVADIAITGGTITGQPFSTRLYIYYDDTTLADTTPAFLATTTSATAQVGAAAGRHFVGLVDTPADGGADTGGTGGGPPGGGGGGSGGGIIP